MIALASLIAGAIVGWLMATRRGGNKLDRAQYAFAFAILFAVIWLFASVFIDRLT